MLLQILKMFVSCFQFVFEGVRGSGVTGDIALDDIRISRGSCRRVPGKEDDVYCHLQKADIPEIKKKTIKNEV